MAQFAAKWMQDSDENYDAFLDAVGFQPEMKHAFLTHKAEMEIGCEGDVWSIKVTIKGNTREDKFKMGEMTDGVTVTGQPTKFIVTLEGDRMKEVSKAGDLEATTVRYIDGGQLVSELTTGNVTARLRWNKA